MKAFEEYRTTFTSVCERFDWFDVIAPKKLQVYYESLAS